jgi:hypothetical protein
MLAAAAACVGVAGCANDAANVALGVGVVTVVGGAMPSNEIEQIYYLGVFDPVEQMPQTIYRVTVRGQASSFSNMKFATGWVPASLIDSLNSDVSMVMRGDAARVELRKGDGDTIAYMETGRRFYLFGPEGFREAPKAHRLALVMGATPEAFFQAVDQVLGTVAGAEASKLTDAERKRILETMLQLGQHREALKDLQLSIAREAGRP